MVGSEWGPRIQRISWTRSTVVVAPRLRTSVNITDSWGADDPRWGWLVQNDPGCWCIDFTKSLRSVAWATRPFLSWLCCPQVLEDSSAIRWSCKDVDISVWYQFQPVTWTSIISDPQSWGSHGVMRSDFDLFCCVLTTSWKQSSREMHFQYIFLFSPELLVVLEPLLKPMWVHKILWRGILTGICPKFDLKTPTFDAVQPAWAEVSVSRDLTQKMLRRSCVIWVWINTYYIIPFLGGWTSIYQLFWCSPGVQGFDTLPYISRIKNVGTMLLNVLTKDIISKPIWNASKVPLAVFLAPGLHYGSTADWVTEEDWVMEVGSWKK